MTLIMDMGLGLKNPPPNMKIFQIGILIRIGYGLVGVPQPVKDRLVELHFFAAASAVVCASRRLSQVTCAARRQYRICEKDDQWAT